MASSGVLRRVALERIDISEEISASIIRVTIDKLGTLVVTSNRRKLRRNTKRARLLVTTNVPSSPILITLTMKALSSSETSVLTRSTLRNIPEDAILHSHCRENLKSYNNCILKAADFLVFYCHVIVLTVAGVCTGNRLYCTLKPETHSYNLQITFTNRLALSAKVFTAQLVMDNGSRYIVSARTAQKTLIG
jgi:hypothetical protein